MTCTFCDIATGTGPATIVAEWPDTIAIFPRERGGKRGCTEGHILVIPRVHVRDAADQPLVTAITMARAAELAKRLGYADCNIITNQGAVATQTVFHLHVHLVPRRAGDGLALPWSAAA
ncbi:HIT family protein [Actinophytocola sp.]|uniref:HIT family protein n=1 Tax=Actinophytocola sp. TaxID=1872138 RepID=UPI002D80316F|nr:HIT family protein [Actinophytocola sp.]HET9144083.1 HIT family protein [Actinophytocola sp.]